MKKKSLPQVSPCYQAATISPSLLIRNPKFTTQINCISDEFTQIQHRVHKFISRFKLIRYFNLSQVTSNHAREFFRHIMTNKAQFFRCVSLPSPFTKKHIKYLKHAKNLVDYKIKKEYYPYRVVQHRNLTTFNFYLKREKFVDNMYQLQVNRLCRFKRIQSVAMDCNWTKEGLGKVRKVMTIFSEYKNLRETFIKIEEDDISLFLHSYHTLTFWKKLKYLNLTYNTADSINGLLEYSGQLISLESLVLNPSRKFHENAIKKSDYNLSGMGKFKNFPVLKILDMTFNLKEITKQAIEVFKSLSYPTSLVNLRLELIIPDMDEIIQKTNPSLTTVTYLTVENQAPFKDFIANHAPLSNLTKFSLILKTKQLLSSHAKLIPAMVKHMKSLTDFDFDLMVSSAKPFRYLALYNNFLNGEKFETVKMKFNTSTIDFVGADLMELDNRMSNLKSLYIYLPNEKIENETFEPFFKAMCLKSLEVLKFHFLQVLDLKKFEKRFEYLSKCKKLHTILLRFMLPELKDLYPDQMLSFFENQINLKEVTLEMASAKSDKYELKALTNALVSKKKLDYAYLKTNKTGMLKTKNARQFKVYEDIEYIPEEYIKY
jgi:hypothetical protein